MIVHIRPTDCLIFAATPIIRSCSNRIEVIYKTLPSFVLGLKKSITHMAHKLIVIVRIELSSLPIKEILHLVEHELKCCVISKRRGKD